MCTWTKGHEKMDTHALFWPRCNLKPALLHFSAAEILHIKHPWCLKFFILKETKTVTFLIERKKSLGLLSMRKYKNSCKKK